MESDEHASGAGDLIVTDLESITDEPPSDSFYHHKVSLLTTLRTLWAHREIVYTLAERDFRVQYKQAALGVLWAVLSPVATLGIFVVVFSRVKSFHPHGVPYALYAFVGILCWNFFSSSLGTGGNALLTNKALLAKTQFPRECFPLETMLVNALNTALSCIPLAILFVAYGRYPEPATLWSPLYIVIELAFTVGVTLAVSGLIIQMRDLTQLLPIIISLGIFATPVIWPFSYVPDHYHLFGGQLVDGHWVGGFYVNLQAVYGFFNPIGPIINDLRGSMYFNLAPVWAPTIAAILGAACYLYFGLRIFKRLEVSFADIA
jgi:ABC-2 type transport system permease protein/lipopolysaccharide transport system permease protein